MHSPGPWYWSNDSMENRCSTTLESAITGYPIIYCNAQPINPYNSLLIESAPSMFSALNESLENIEEWETGCTCAGPRHDEITGSTKSSPAECKECTEALIIAIKKKIIRAILHATGNDLAINTMWMPTFNGKPMPIDTGPFSSPEKAIIELCKIHSELKFNLKFNPMNTFNPWFPNRTGGDKVIAAAKAVEIIESGTVSAIDADLAEKIIKESFESSRPRFEEE